MTRSSSIFDSAKGLISHLIGLFSTRLELAAMELDEHKSQFARLLVAGLISGIALLLALFFLSAFIIVALWDTNRLLAIGGVALFYLVIALFFGQRAIALSQHEGGLFPMTLGELKKDMILLKQAGQNTAEEDIEPPSANKTDEESRG
ncbi:phage holin family protein [Ampullimonas aquatilis]|uniref:phage holin family protein n=1 Tax=Ampullimonas aquatilis TaxID=1341549 RepID=UPI003C773AB0